MPLAYLEYVLRLELKKQYAVRLLATYCPPLPSWVIE